MREGWKEVKLGDYYEVRSGLSKPASEFGSGFPFLSFKNVFNNYFLPDELEELVNTSESERENMSIKKGDVFLTRTSETNDELGMSSVALKDYPNATFNGFCKRLRPKENNDFEPKYIGFYLRSPKFRAEISQFANLTTRASLNNEIINRLNLIVPPLETQKKIASTLSGYDDLIENNLKRIKILEEMAQQTYEEWFVRMRFPEHESATINPKTGLPEGWKHCKMGEILNFTNGFAFKSKDYDEKGIYSIVTIKNVQEGYFENAKFDKILEIPSKVKDSQILKTGDLVMSLTGNVGRLCFVYGENLLLNQRVCKIDSETIGFVYCTLMSTNFKNKIENLANGTAQQNLSTIDMENLIIDFPKNELIDEFETFVNPLFKSILNLNIQNQRLREARDILLPRLMMGMVEV